jgi:SAM-dependent methyltransferase
MTTAGMQWRRWLAGRWAAVGRLLRLAPLHPFDRAHGVDTDGLIYADPPHNQHNAGYYATAPSLFHGAIAMWRATLAGTGRSLEDYTLVDIGCGKGRVLMLAAGYGFREIVGVELDPRLVGIARKNLQKWRNGLRSTARIRIAETDALDLPLPDGPAVLFYFNSFEREMIQMWLSRLARHAADRTHPVDLIYIHPEFDALVRQAPGVQPVAVAEIPFSKEDAKADAFAVDSDRCAIYRWAGCA